MWAAGSSAGTAGEGIACEPTTAAKSPGTAHCSRHASLCVIVLSFYNPTLFAEIGREEGPLSIRVMDHLLYGPPSLLHFNLREADRLDSRQIACHPVFRSRHKPAEVPRVQLQDCSCSL